MAVFHWDLWFTVGALIAVVALGIWAIFKIRSWRAETFLHVPLTLDEQIEHYRAMVEDGSLSPEEFARIKDRLEHGPIRNPSTTQPPDTSFREF